ncbi:protein kinase domain-containing protein [Thalassoporum mexicanum]
MLSVHLWRSAKTPSLKVGRRSGQLQKTRQIVKSWNFADRNVIKIGRAADNDVILAHPAVSRYHAELSHDNEANGWRYRNLGVNHTYWQDQKVDRLVVSDHIELRLAHNGPMLEFQVESAPERPEICLHENNEPQDLFCKHCGTPLQMLREINQYQVLQTLGQGGMGTTYQVWSPDRGLQVLKEMNADLIRNTKAIELFEREANILKRLRHRGIPRFYDFFAIDNKKYLVMSVIHGQDLEQLIKVNDSVSPTQAITWMIQLCDILSYLHNQVPPIIHRDVKPANLIVRSVDQSLVLVDFGAVKEISVHTGTMIGAPSYTAPEQARGRPVIQSDLYAIAPTLVYLLTGDDPAFYLEDRGDGSRMYIDHLLNLPLGLADLVAKLSAPIPGDRYQNAKQVAEALKVCLSFDRQF